MTHLNTARIHLRKAKVLGVDPCTLKDIMLLGVLKHLFGALKALRSLKNSQNTHFYPLAPNCSAPWLPNPNPAWQSPAAWPKLPSLQVSSKYSNVKGNFVLKNPRTDAPYMRLRRLSIPESEPPRFAQWLNEL